MIRILGQGKYLLSETIDHTKILVLNDAQRFAWIAAGEIGEILIFSQKKFNPAYILAKGAFRLYEVKEEPDLTDLEHLELFIGDGSWQGYLLPTGLPSIKDRRNRIIATREIITKSTH